MSDTPSMDPVTITLPKAEWLLLRRVLDDAADQFSNHGCNDLPQDVVALLPRERWAGIAQALMGDEDAGDWMPGDSDVMTYYANKIGDAVA